MKLILTVHTFKSGEKNGVAWASASGFDAMGRKARAAFRDPQEGDGRKRATAMIEQMARVIPEGQDVTDIRPIVECLGSWRDRTLHRDGKPITRGGEPVKERYFEVASFNILSGPALELRRTKQRASEVVDAVSAALEAGDGVKAAETALEFLRLFSGRPADEIEDVDADEPLADAAAPAAAEPAAEPPVEGTAAPIEGAILEAVPAARTILEIEAGAQPVVPVPDLPVAGPDTTAVDVEPVVEAAAVADVSVQDAEPTVDPDVAPQPTQTPADDFESLVAAVEAAPPVHHEPSTDREVPARPAPAAPARPDLGVRTSAAPRPALPPRPAMGGLVRPGMPAAGRGAGVVGQAPRAPQPAQAARPDETREPRSSEVVTTPSRAAAPQPAASRGGSGPAGLRPVSAPRVAPSAAVTPPGATGYRTPAPGEDPEALAAAHLARTGRPGMPQSLRPAPARPGSR